MSEHSVEVERGNRFEFGKNWKNFLNSLNNERILIAETSLKGMLGVDTLAGKSFLDIGSGSGLFSLCAKRLGANVCSFDYDPDSVWCTAELKRRYFSEANDWAVDRGSVLDSDYVKNLGTFDIVYSWGVLHHTGQMWKAFENILPTVKPGGKLMIAIYNNQGLQSNIWTFAKKTYNRLPSFLKPVFAFLVMVPREIRSLLVQTVRGTPMAYFKNIINYKESSLRGMSYYHDIIDWIGGYPFEVAKPEEVFNFFYAHGFTLVKMTTCAGSIGCNQFVFIKNK